MSSTPPIRIHIHVPHIHTYIHTGQEPQREQVNFTTAAVEEDIRAAAQRCC